ncbi:DNA damage checkpoint control protein rad1 [Neolecta irregularis DAH-3]|uniref:DNA damage checkpoint control protein rad1 n=1 Tax=Neolecta irregularis (strain DAH-3) TaxID=1198029 RepID=A0A1U7LWW8_NEOID|nr:DNA damage checkpoint control protein rad1 [Neolecta irregularis DAH-3]|eukprot:OLL27063.1 DNA damage checkpoint control protein rad1 [Neolecta irregularis DAH-3]
MFPELSPLARTNNAHVMQAHAFLENSSLFQSYVFTFDKIPPRELDNVTEDGEDDDSVSFVISLTALLECLNIFGADARERPGFARGDQHPMGLLRLGGTCRFLYEAEGCPLILMVEENGVLTTCELTTYEAEEEFNISLSDGGLASKIIMKSEWLHDAIQELETPQTEHLTIRTSPRKPHFRLGSYGNLGSAEMDYPNDRSVLETFICPDVVKNSYRFTMIKLASKAMSLATKASVRTDENGVLSIQFMISFSNGKNSFVDFRYLPEVEEHLDRSEDTNIHLDI